MLRLDPKRKSEVFTYTQAMRQDDRAEFIQAMIKEVEDHEGRDHWELVLRSTIPKGIKTIQAVWSFKRKRFPDGTLNKHKARLCAHGGMQQWGENYWETYSPVVNMLTVRLETHPHYCSCTQTRFKVDRFCSSFSTS
jgi:hypothetical protein